MKESIKLYDKLVKENHYNKVFDLSIIYEVDSFLQDNDFLVANNNTCSNWEHFGELCNRVSNYYLKCDCDIALNYELVKECYNNLLEDLRKEEQNEKILF